MASICCTCSGSETGCEHAEWCAMHELSGNLSVAAFMAQLVCSKLDDAEIRELGSVLAEDIGDGFLVEVLKICSTKGLDPFA